METQKCHVVITGGHITPALAVIQHIKKQYSHIKISVIGRKHALEGSKVLSEEYNLLEKYSVPFYPIITGRLQRYFGFQAIGSMIKIPFGFLQSFFILLKLRPSVVLSFGGYVALPVSYAAKILGIPICTHEQGSVPGIANEWIAKIANVVCVTFEETKNAYKGKNVIVTGLPLRDEIVHPPTMPSFHIPNQEKPIIYITGGSTGAVSMNDIVFSIIPEIVKGYTVIHQVGRISIEAAKNVKKALPSSLQEEYIVSPYFDTPDVGWILKNCTLVVSRAGANTISEIAYYHKPNILIPIPWAGDKEQVKNASIMEKYSLSLVIPQTDLTAQRLINALHDISSIKNNSHMPPWVNSNAAAIITEKTLAACRCS